MSYHPIVIIGAPRSGTNMLRDVLTKLPGFGTWPCDEINYIWRHGNAGFPTDEFRPEQANPRAVATIRRAFDRLSRQGFTHVVEKTCANSLRVPFVDRVLPEARYLYIVRDGCDATASAMDRWRAELDLAYIARKARFVPWTDVPYYASRFLVNRLHRLVGEQRHVASWGPRFGGMKEILTEQGLAAVCAAQWAHCVASSDRAFAEVEPARVHTLSYERFVTSPQAELGRIVDFLGVEADRSAVEEAVSEVTDRSVGKGRKKLTEAELELIEPLLGPQLARHGYTEPI